MARIIGIGAVMVYANDPAALAEWYGQKLGIRTAREGDAYYAELKNDANGVSTQFAVFAAGETIPPGLRPVMVNYQVDRFEEFVGDLQRAGVRIERTFERIYGKFAHVRDPEGNRIEIWQAPEPPKTG